MATKEFKIEEAVNTAEELNSNTLEAMFDEIIDSGNKQLKNIEEHITECVAQIDKRLAEGKRITILQKNVLLNLLNSREQLYKRVEEVYWQRDSLSKYRNSDLYKVYYNEDSEE